MTARCYIMIILCAMHKYEQLTCIYINYFLIEHKIRTKIKIFPYEFDLRFQINKKYFIKLMDKRLNFNKSILTLPAYCPVIMVSEES